MSWQQVRRRHELASAVLAGIAESGRPVVPAGLRPAVETEFGQPDQFLRYVQLRWYRAFDARLDAVLEAGPADPRAALVDLWRDLASALPAERLLLDAHAGDPALADLAQRHDAALHRATGVHFDPARIAPPAAPRRGRRRHLLARCPLSGALRGTARA